jgi:hypothetical protein
MKLLMSILLTAVVPVNKDKINIATAMLSICPTIRIIPTNAEAVP